MKALISPNELTVNFDSTSGYRIAQVEAQSFEVAAPLFWVDCPDDCVADLWYYDTTVNECLIKPVEVTE